MSGRIAIGIVGAGRAGTALGVALARAGWPVGAVSSRDPGRRAAVAGLVPGATIMSEPGAVSAVSDLVLLAVPDDAILDVATELRPRPGSMVAHLSGVHPATVLRPAVDEGVAVGAFHPLVAFADVERAIEALRGGFVAIDGDSRAVGTLTSMAEALGARPVILGGPAATPDPLVVKAAHHAAAVLAAGGFVSLLDAIAELARVAGMEEATAVEVYGSLVRQGLVNAREVGIGAALTGPVVRGDVGTLRAHVHAITATAPDVWELYLAAARRQLAVARRRGVIDSDDAAAIEDVLEHGDP